MIREGTRFLGSRSAAVKDDTGAGLKSLSTNELLKKVGRVSKITQFLTHRFNSQRIIP